MSDRLHPVAPGVQVATARRYTTTSTLVRGPSGGCLLVDPALSPGELRALAAEIAGHGCRTVLAFSTHPHWDHLLWHDTLGAAPRLGTATTARESAGRAAALAAEAERDTPGTGGLVRPVSALPDGAATVPWDGPEAVVLPHPAHAPGHAALLLPAARVLVAGDMLSDLEIPLLDLNDPDPVGCYHAGLTVLAAQLGAVDVVIPGHGHPATAAAAQARLEADRRYLDALTAGRVPTDDRLTDPTMAAEHRRQARQLVP